MASGRRVVIEFIGQDKSLSSTADKAGRSTSKLGATLKNIGKSAALGFAAAAVVGGKALYDMTKAAVEDEAAQKKLATTLKNAAGATDSQIASVEDWISAQGKALGVTDDELRPALERLTVATGDVAKAQDLARLAMDVSAGTGKSLEQVSTALAKAQNGQVSALSRLGINTKNAAGETISFEKAQRRMADAFKGQASKQANTLQGKLARLKLILAETGEEIGARLIPVVTKMADWFLREGLPALERFGGYLQRTIPPIIEKVRSVIQKFTKGGSGDFAKFIADVKGIIKDGLSIVRSIWDNFGKHIVEFLKGAFDSIKDIVKGAFLIIKGIFKVVSGVLKGDWKKVWEGIKDILKGAAKILIGLVKNLWNTIKFAFKSAGVVLKALVGKLWDLIKALFKKGVDWVWNQIKDLPGKIKKAAGLYMTAGKWIIGKLWDAAKILVPKISNWVFEQVQKVPGRIKSLAGKMLEAGKTLIGKLFEGIKNVAKNAAGFAGDVAGGIADALKGHINSMIDRLNSAIPNSLGWGKFAIDIEDSPIPHLARGTNFHKGGLALVGEEGPELVNLPRGSKVTPHGESMGALRGLSAGDDNRPIVVQFVLDGKVIEQSLIRRSRDTGRPIQVSTL